MERKEQSESTETRHDKEKWITPEVFDSPAIAVTEGTGGTTNRDAQAYS